MNLSEYINQNKELNDATEIIFYGGSFNPWHAGHSACVDLAPKEIPLVVIPDNNPHKQVNSKKQLDFSKLNDELYQKKKNIFLFDGFYKADTPNPTITWIKELSALNKNLSLLMGFDSFIKLDTWKDYPELFSHLCSIYVVSRLDDIQYKTQKLKDYHNIAPNLEFKFLGGHEYEHLSSTEIRKNN